MIAEGQARSAAVHRAPGGVYSGRMIAVIFEFTPRDGRFADYKALAEGLADDVRNADGFLSI